jgi:type III restriction enzyme
MVILIEVKGNHLDGSDSLKKLRLGKKWASKAGENYRYFMVFEDERLEGAYTVNELFNIMKSMS